MVSEKNSGLMMVVLAIVLAILIFVVPGYIYWIYWIVVAILLIYGLYLYLNKG
jgi:uncharacterized membrane protein YgaE (UPF0421/DUF939 family)